MCELLVFEVMKNDMKYESFTEEVQKNLTTIVTEKIGEGTVVIRNVLKNNGVRMKAVSILRKNENATPSIYLKQYYNEFKKGRSVESICNEIFQIYEESLKAFRENISLEQLSDFETVQDKIFYRLINYEMNRSLLADVPHYRFLDLAIVFFICLDSQDDGVTSVLIHHFNVDAWGKTAEEIRECALKNTWKKYPVWIRNMEDVISDMILKDIKATYEDQEEGMVEEDSFYGNYDISQVEQVIKEEVKELKAEKNMEMYVMSNSHRLNGAACITYPGALKQFAEEHQSDLCIIPSSIHEVILVLGTDWDMEWLDRMIRQVNKEDLDPVEILSDHVYIYRRDLEKIVYPGEEN